MRFVRILLIAALCLGLSACSDGPPAQLRSPLADRSGNYSAQAVIRSPDLAASATLSQQTPEACSVSFTAPESLRDMVFVFRQDSVDVGYKGQSIQFDPRSVPGGAVAGIAVSAVDMAMRDDGVALSRTEQGMELTGRLDVGEFTLWIDPETGSLLKLLIPSEELEIEFQNFSFLD